MQSEKIRRILEDAGLPAPESLNSAYGLHTETPE